MNHQTSRREDLFSGNIFLFHAFDVGDDINLTKILKDGELSVSLSAPSPLFKNYHIPLTINLPNTLNKNCVNAQIHSFGVISLRYRIPFQATLEQLRTQVHDIYDQYSDISSADARFIFDAIKPFILQQKFYQLRNSYIVIQVDPTALDAVQLTKEYGSIIASTLRFERELLSEYKKNEILESGIRYYRGDLLIVDTQAAFIYDDEYDESLVLFEFGNMQQCELKYFDRMLDEQLSVVYVQEVKHVPLKTYIPFVGVLMDDPITTLSKLRVDISVITERLSNSVKLADDRYYSELYALIIEKLDVKKWQDSINNKLEIIETIANIYNEKAEAIRENILSVAIILLFIIEIIFGVLNLLKH